MSQLLLTVPRDEPARYAYFQHVCGGKAIEVIEDRRVAQRRRREMWPMAERRGPDRRRRDITEDLEKFGWALVRHRVGREARSAYQGTPTRGGAR